MTLNKGNTKLGQIRCFNLPPLITCPGASAVCSRLCYATKRRFRNENVKKSHKENLEKISQPNFVGDTVKQLNRARKKQTVRIHASGDFHEPWYVQKWFDIATQCPTHDFYFYTRSWGRVDLMAEITKLAELPNVTGWLSFDSSMPVPPKLPNFNRCYLSEQDGDEPPVVVDLVFRNKRTSVIRRTANKSFVCPHEQGLKSSHTIKCETCKLCFNNQKLAKTKSAQPVTQLGAVGNSESRVGNELGNLERVERRELDLVQITNPTHKGVKDLSIGTWECSSDASELDRVYFEARNNLFEDFVAESVFDDINRELLEISAIVDGASRESTDVFFDTSYFAHSRAE